MAPGSRFCADRWKLLACALFAVSCAVLGAARALAGQQVPASAGPGAPDLIDDLITANRVLAREGVVDAFGRVSVRHNLNPNRFFMSRSLAPGLVTPDDPIGTTLTATAPTRRPAPRVFRALHPRRDLQSPAGRSGRRARPLAVALPFGVSTVPLRPCFTWARSRRQRALFDIRKAAGMTDMLVRDAARGRALAQALADTRRADAGPRRRRCRSGAAVRRRPEHLPGVEREGAAPGHGPGRASDLPGSCRGAEGDGLWRESVVRAALGALEATSAGEVTTNRVIG